MAEEMLLTLTKHNAAQGHSSQTGNTGINLPSVVDDIMWALQRQQKAEQCMAALRELSGQLPTASLPAEQPRSH